MCKCVLKFDPDILKTSVVVKCMHYFKILKGISVSLIFWKACRRQGQTGVDRQ